MGVAKAALESVNRYLARDLGPQGIRSNLVSAGPLRTMAARGIGGFDLLAGLWNEQAPLHWDDRDAGPVADAALVLLSEAARGITGEIRRDDRGECVLALARAVAPSGEQQGGDGSGEDPRAQHDERLAERGVGEVGDVADRARRRARRDVGPDRLPRLRQQLGWERPARRRVAEHDEHEDRDAGAD